MVQLILIVLAMTFMTVWVWSLGNNNKTKAQEPRPLEADFKGASDPINAATSLMVAVARMDTMGKVSGKQGGHIRQELQTHMAMTPGQASAVLESTRQLTRHLNRAQSILPKVVDTLRGKLTDGEITELVGMLTRVAEVEGEMNRDQMEFIAEVRDATQPVPFTSDYHLAQINIAFFKTPKFNTANDDFHKAIDGVNAIAESAPGFVWRLVDDEPQRDGIDLFADPDMIINMSVWEDQESLSAFVYRDKAHRDIMRRKEEWFQDIEIYMALWWVKAGDIPTLQDAAERLDILAANGPTEEAFTFKDSFPAPDTPAHLNS